MTTDRIALRAAAALAIAAAVLILLGLFVLALGDVDSSPCPADHGVLYPGRVVCSDRPVNRQYGGQP